MKFENKIYDEERALYGLDGAEVKNCTFAGPADGESAIKECRNVKVEDCTFELRYPFWHVDDAEVKNITMTESCRAALWYDSDIGIKDSRLHGTKALRECQGVLLEGCDIDSEEFGWRCTGVTIKDTALKSSYPFFGCREMSIDNLTMHGKYSFQYVEDVEIRNSNLDTKDAFWHAKNVVVKNSVVNGEYLAWYAENITFENCKIKGTQPLCYCKGLKLINCEMADADLSFEKSEVDANIIGHILSIKNPASGTIRVSSVGEIINDDPRAKGTVLVGDLEKK